MHIAIVTNGQLDESLLPAIRKAEYIIGVDRAAFWLLEHHVTPDIALGDFDSTTDKELSTIKHSVKTFQEPPHPKYKTDLELAVEHALSLQPKEVVMYGATGTRLDHTLAAVHLLEQFLKTKTRAKIRDSYNEITLLDTTLTIAKSSAYNYFSVIAYTKKVVVSIQGARYPLNHHSLFQDVSLGISNEIVANKAKIAVHAGIALIIQSRD